MKKTPVVAVVGTFDSKGEEHFFLRDRIEKSGLGVLTVNVGTKEPARSAVSHDLYAMMQKKGNSGCQ